MAVAHIVEAGQGGQANAHAARTNFCHTRIDHFQRKAAAVVNRAAVFVTAVVGAVTDELVHQVTVGTVNLHTIKTSTNGVSRSMAELLDNFFDFIRR